MCVFSFLIRFSGVLSPKSWAPLFEQPLRQLRDVFRVLNQVANLNFAHSNSVFGQTRVWMEFSVIFYGILRLIQCRFPRTRPMKPNHRTRFSKNCDVMANKKLTMLVGRASLSCQFHHQMKFPTLRSREDGFTGLGCVTEEQTGVNKPLL